MTLDSIVLIVLGAIIMFRAGWIMREIHAQKAIEELIKDLEGRPEQDDEPKADTVVEHHDGIFLAYDTEGNFLGQGNTIQEVSTALNKRFPDRKFTISEKNAKEMDIV